MTTNQDLNTNNEHSDVSTTTEKFTTLSKPEISDERPYSAFTRKQKWLLVALSSLASTISGLASNIYFPALPTVAADLHVSTTLVDLTVTSYMIFQGLSPSLWSAIADSRGRRICYLCTLIVFLAACIGLANTHNYATLVVLRCIQSAGSASTICLGAGIIGDISTREERGGFTSFSQAGMLIPLGAGPIIGGALAEAFGWRSVFWFLAIYSGVLLLLLALSLPETLRSIVGDGSQETKGFFHSYPLRLYQRYQTYSRPMSPAEEPPKMRIDILAPFRILVNRRAVLMIVFLSIHYAVWQMSLTAQSTLFTSTYHLTTTQTGLTFLANGVGSTIGTLTTGHLLNWNYRRVKADFESRSQISTPSASPSDLEKLPPKPDTIARFPLVRARLLLLPIFALLQSGAVLTFGWTLDFAVPIAVPIVATFVTGWTAISIQSIVTTYLIDLFTDQSASAGAALNVARCLLGAAGTAVVGLMIEGLGVGCCFTLLAGIMVLALGLVGVETWTESKGRQKEKEGGNI